MRSALRITSRPSWRMAASRSGPTREALADARPGRIHGDPSEWGCHSLPVSPGLRRESRRAPLADLWGSSEVFTGIRQRTSLGGRCGACEMNGHCGGCRARAYGMTGDVMAEDPLCTHTPGTFAGSPLLMLREAGGTETRAVQYGLQSPATIAWDDDAAARMKKIPALFAGWLSGPSRSRAARTA